MYTSRRSMTPILFLSILVLMLFFFFGNSFSYVLRGPHILGMMIKKIGMPVDLVLQQRLTIYPQDPDDPDLEIRVLSEKTRYRYPDKFRSDIITVHSSRISVVAGEDSLTIVNGRVQDHRETWDDYYKDILLYRVRTMIQDRLSFLGVDVESSSYQRFEGKIYYVIGTLYSDLHVPQIWVDKETLMPSRFIQDFSYHEGEIRFNEIRYLEWKKIKKIWIPMSVEFIQDMRVVKRIDVTNVDVNSKIDSSYFDFSLLKSEYVNSTGDYDSQTDISDVQKKIDDFGKIIE